MLLMYSIVQKRFEGTRVTIETFLAWKAKFDCELTDLRRQKGKDDTSSKKLTGTDDSFVDTLVSYFSLPPFYESPFKDEWQCNHMA